MSCLALLPRRVGGDRRFSRLPGPGQGLRRGKSRPCPLTSARGASPPAPGSHRRRRCYASSGRREPCPAGGAGQVSSGRGINAPAPRGEAALTERGSGDGPSPPPDVPPHLIPAPGDTSPEAPFWSPPERRDRARGPPPPPRGVARRVREGAGLRGRRFPPRLPPASSSGPTCRPRRCPARRPAPRAPRWGRGPGRATPRPPAPPPTLSPPWRAAPHDPAEAAAACKRREPLPTAALKPRGRRRPAPGPPRSARLGPGTGSGGEGGTAPPLREVEGDCRQFCLSWCFYGGCLLGQGNGGCALPNASFWAHGGREVGMWCSGDGKLLKTGCVRTKNSSCRKNGCWGAGCRSVLLCFVAGAWAGKL